MKTTIIKLGEIYPLEQELIGVFNKEGEMVVKGLRNEKVSLVLKYHLNNLIQVISDEKAKIEKIKEELVSTHGTKTETGFEIPFFEEDGKTPNQNFVKFNEEFSKLLNEEKEIEHYEFTLSDIEKIETNLDFPVFFKFVSA